MAKPLPDLNALLLLAAIAGGLLHVGVTLPGMGQAAWSGQAFVVNMMMGQAPVEETAT